MPEITVTHIALLALTTIIGLAVGWFLRGSRSTQEKTAISEGWQVQLEAQRVEHKRLVSQNKSLMEQVNQHQASAKDGTNRARELSDALKEAFARRDELQRQIKEIRGNLESAVEERDKLRTDANDVSVADESLLLEKDEQIDRLGRELKNWQDRVPPLIERFRERNEEAAELEAELETARLRIADLEAMLNSDETRVEPVDTSALTDALDASNDPEESPPDDIDLDEATAELAESFDNYADDADETGTDDAEVDAELSIDPYDEELLQPNLDPVAIAEVDESVPEATAKDAADDREGETHDDEEGPDVDEEVLEAPDNVEPIAEAIPEAVVEPIGGLRDNLRLIKGIGPAIEKTLNELGIFRFHQVAELSDYDIERIAKRLKGFRARIEREDWLGQARELHDQKSADLASNQS